MVDAAEGRVGTSRTKERPVSATLLWILAVVLVVVGIIVLIQGSILLGILLIIAGCLVGPGGYSLFRSRA